MYISNKCDLHVYNLVELCYAVLYLIFLYFLRFFVNLRLLLPVLHCTVDVMMALLNLCFYLLFNIFLLSLFTRQKNTFGHWTLLQ